MSSFRAQSRDLHLAGAPHEDTPFPRMITHVKIGGMSCQHCVNAVFTALTPVPGISSAQVTIGDAVVEHDGRATAEQLREAVESAGYTVEGFEEEKRRLPIL